MQISVILALMGVSVRSWLQKEDDVEPFSGHHAEIYPILELTNVTLVEKHASSNQDAVNTRAITSKCQ